MKSFLAIIAFALVAPIYGKAHPWAGGHKRFHSLKGPAVLKSSVSASAVLAGATGSVQTIYPLRLNDTTSPLNGTSSSLNETSSSVNGTSSSVNGTSSSVNGTSSKAPPGVHIGLGENCYRPNGVPMGWLPDSVNISTIQNKVNSDYKPCTYGNYAQITSTSSMAQPNSQMDSQGMPSSLKGAIYTIALQPFIPFAEVSASSVNASMNELLAEGPEIIWLRLAHEMNWYTNTNPINTDTSVSYVGTPAEFKTMWQSVASAVDRSRVKMFWSAVPPYKQGDTIDTLDAMWFPGEEHVDIVGLDAYGEVLNGEQVTFDFHMKEFCAKYPTIPVALAETGWLNGGSAEQKQYWLKQVSSADTMKTCPQYIGESPLDSASYIFTACSP